MNWEKRRLEDVADFCLGKMLDQKKNRGDLMPYLANVNVRWGEFDFDGLREMRFEQHELDRFGLKYGDIVMCEGGEPGRCAVWKEQVPGMMLQKALHRIRPHQCLDHRFLYYSFLYKGRAGRFASLFTGATIKHLPREKLALVEVEIPPLPVQHRVADILSAYDDLIENNRRRIQLLEAAARLLYQEWFVHLRFPGHEHVPITDGVPEGWEKAPLGQATSIVMGNSPKGDTYNETAEGMPLVNGPVEFGEMFTKRVKWTTKPSRVCHANDLVVCVRGSTTGRNVKSDGEYCLGRGVCAISGSEQSFVDELFKANLPAILALTTGATFPMWTGPALKSFLILWPTEDLRKHFEMHCAPIAAQIRCLYEQNQRLSAARDLLLPRLMNGEVSV